MMVNRGTTDQIAAQSEREAKEGLDFHDLIKDYLTVLALPSRLSQAVFGRAVRGGNRRSNSRQTAQHGPDRAIQSARMKNNMGAKSWEGIAKKKIAAPAPLTPN